MDQQDFRIDPHRASAEDMRRERLAAERRTISVGATAAVLLAAIAVLMIGLSYLKQDDKSAQKTDVPSSSERVATPPSGTIGTSPPPATPTPVTPR
jgi:hypothetical protein